MQPWPPFRGVKRIHDKNRRVTVIHAPFNHKDQFNTPHPLLRRLPP